LGYEFHEDAFMSGAGYSIPFYAHYHKTNVIDMVTTGRVQWTPDYWYRPEFWVGLSAGATVQSLAFPVFYSTAWGVSWAAASWLARKTFSPLALLASATENYDMAADIQEGLGATEADFVKSSWMLKWSKSGDIGAGGSMPMVPSDGTWPPKWKW